MTAAKQAERNVELAEVYAEYQKALVAATAIRLQRHDHVRGARVEKMTRAAQRAQRRVRIFSGGRTSGYERRAEQDHRVDRGRGTARAHERPNLFVVGDEKQAIFRFQGASLENFHYFRDHYKDVVLITLRNNYRSTQAILDAAQGVSPREAALVAQRRAPRKPRASRGALVAGQWNIISSRRK